jgi:hypothetical protein
VFTQVQAGSYVEAGLSQVQVLLSVGGAMTCVPAGIGDAAIALGADEVLVSTRRMRWQTHADPDISPSGVMRYGLYAAINPAIRSHGPLA